MTPTILLLAVGVVPLLYGRFDNLPLAFDLASLALWLWCLPLWLILAASVFQAGRAAFGMRAGLTYAALAFVLMFLFGLGVFVIPLMLEADAHRLLGGPSEEPEASRGTDP